MITSEELFAIKAYYKENIIDFYYDVLKINISDKQKMIALSFRDYERTCCSAGRQVGKDQPLSAEILTPNGWVTMGELSIGDKVIGSDGTAYSVTDIFPQGIKDIYKLTFANGETVECGLEHLWKHHTYSDRAKGREEFRVDTLEHIMNKYYCEDAISPDGKHRKRISIPTVKPIELKEVEHYIKPYTMGALLGNGSFRNTAVLYSTDDIQTVDYMLNEMPQLNISYKGRYDYRVTDLSTRIDGSNSPLIYELKNLGLWGHKSKFIPKEYLYDSVENRIKLLNGLCDTDGSIYGKCIIEYCSASKQLANDVVFLVRSLGGKVRWHNKWNKVYKRYYYSLIIKIQNINPFRLPRKADKFYVINRTNELMLHNIEYVGKKEAQCIMVNSPDNTYITDDFIVTHNTTLMAGLILWVLFCIDGSKVVVTAGTYSQLINVVWSTLSKIYLGSVLFDLSYFKITKDRIVPLDVNLAKINFGAAISPSKPDSILGFDNAHFLIDEASLAEQETVDNMIGGMIFPWQRMLMIGNPTNPTGVMADIMYSDDEYWNKLSLSQFDCTWIDPEKIEAAKKKYGEDSFFYQVFVLGKFCRNANNSVISRDDIKNNTDDYFPINENTKEIHVGVDPARFGEDTTVITIGSESLIDSIIQLSGLDAPDIALRVYNEVVNRYEHINFKSINVKVYIKVDTVGFGGGVAGDLRKMKTSYMHIFDVQAHKRASNRELYGDTATEMYFDLRDRLKEGSVILPKDDEIMEECTTKEYFFDSRNRFKLETKDEHKKKIKRSPDKADSLVLWSYKKPIENKVNCGVIYL